MSKQALKGLKVADFTWVAAGPLVTKYLSDHGATVVRVESAHRVDPLRLASPFKDGVPGVDRSGFYASYNTNKYDLALNMTNSKALGVARELIMWADVVAENFTPGVMERWGLDYASVVKFRPDIVYYSSSQQGQTGPHQHHAGYGNHAVSLAGITHLTGWPGEDAVMPFGAYTDFISPRFGAAALLAALNYRRRTGKGQQIDLSQLETALQFLAPLILNGTVTGVQAHRRGNRDPYACPHGAYPCKGEDRWCAIAAFTQEQWRRLVEVMGNPAWASQPKFDTFHERKANEDQLDRLISRWTAHLTAEEVMEKLQRVGVPAGVVQTCEDLFKDPQLKYRKHFVKLEHSEIGWHHYESPSFKMSKTPSHLYLSAPCLGQHTEFVLSQLLGMSDQEITELMDDGALE